MFKENGEEELKKFVLSIDADTDEMNQLRNGSNVKCILPVLKRFANRILSKDIDSLEEAAENYNNALKSKKLGITTGGEDDIRELVINSISKLGDKEESPKDAKTGQGLKIMTPSQLMTRLQIFLAQKQTGNNSQKLKNEIIQIIYSLYRSKALYNHLIKTI